MPRKDFWIVAGVFALLVGGALGMCFLFDWASDRSPWVHRVVLFLFATAIGYRIGRALRPAKPDAKRPNWSAIGVAVISAILVGYFGMYRPAVRDWERDQAYETLLSDGREITSDFEGLLRDAPEPDSGEPVPVALRGRQLVILDREIAWIERYRDELARFTPDQRRELSEQFQRMGDAGKSANARMALLKPKPKKE